MIEPFWNVEDPGSDERVSEVPEPSLVSMHFVRSTLRRRWRLWVGASCVGLVLGIVAAMLFPSGGSGTVTLLLAHEAGQDPAVAMTTDVSLLTTRTVASDVIRKLGLSMSPEAFQQSVVAVPVTPSVLQLTVSGPDPAAAKVRAKTLATAYLAFRSRQLQSQSDALVAGYQQRVTQMQSEVAGLTRKYEALSASGPAGQSEAADVLTQRAELNTRIGVLQQSIDDASLESGAVATASHVLDSAIAVPPEGKKRLVLAAASGLVGGAGLGIGIALFLAVTSDKLRRRADVATALGVPVQCSVGRLEGGPTSRLRGVRRAEALEVLVHAMGCAVPASGRGEPARLALVSVDSDSVAEAVVARLGVRLADEGRAVVLVDLGATGRLGQEVEAVRRSAGAAAAAVAGPVVFRPSGLPALARAPIPEDDPARPAWERAEIVLTLFAAEPAVGAEELGSWTDGAAVLVTAGSSTAERLRTVARLVRAGGVQPQIALLCGADRADESLGVPEAGATGAVGAVAVNKHRRP